MRPGISVREGMDAGHAPKVVGGLARGRKEDARRAPGPKGIAHRAKVPAAIALPVVALSLIHI